MKEKLTIEIDKEDIKKIDDLVDGEIIKNRSEAIDLILSKELKKFSVNKALILAGGKGTRMRPFTYEIPKSMIPVKGKPLLQHILELLRKYEIYNIILSVGYLKEKVEEYFGNGSKFGVSINYVKENEELGTAGPLRLAENFIDGDTFLMLNGDILANINLHKFIHFHFKHNGLGTIALTPVNNPEKFGVAELEGGKIVRFVEKPKHAKSNLINAGIYILSKKVISYVPERGLSMLEKDVFPKLASEGKLFGYKFSGQWFDTGTYEAYEKAIKNWRGI